MSEKEKIFEELTSLFETFVKAHKSTTKVGARDARKLLGEIKKLATPYRKASVDEDKK